MLEHKKDVSFKWFSAIVPKPAWNNYYSKLSTTYVLLSSGSHNVTIGFLAVIPPANCLEISNIEELRTIDLHMRAVNSHPFVFKEIQVKT
jgi:hypothetical protein